MSDEPTYWFPAKRRGWGWGWPKVWQGQLIMGLFYLLVFAGAVAILPSHGALPFVLYCVLLCVLLVAVCWWKGEPPGWRSGDS